MINKFIPVNTPLLNSEDAKAVYDTVKTGWISSEGPRVKEFEKKVSKWVNRKYASCVSSGTATLHLSLLALGIGPGDEVIIPALSYIATANVIELVGAKPVFVDVNMQTFNIDVKKIFNGAPSSNRYDNYSVWSKENLKGIS